MPASFSPMRSRALYSTFVRRFLALVVVLVAAASAAACSLLLHKESSRRKNVTGSLFTDVTEASGIRFRFHGDLIDAKLIPTMGGGAALADFDGDGNLDLVLVQQVKSATKWRKAGRTQPLAECTRLFRNRGDGTFDDVTERSGVVACGWGVTAMWADLDNDGFPDLVIGNAGEANLVFRNKGDGTFERMEKTGLEGGKFTVALAALDIDGDGLPDVYIGNYLETDPDRESKAKATSFMTPDEYKGQDNQMLRNLGGWKFEDVTDASGTRDPGSKTIGAVALDYDGDGKTDLYVSNDQWRNTLFHNEGGGRFRDVSDETGTGYPGEGSTTAFGGRKRSGIGRRVAVLCPTTRPRSRCGGGASWPWTTPTTGRSASASRAGRSSRGSSRSFRSGSTRPRAISRWESAAMLSASSSSATRAPRGRCASATCLSRRATSGDSASSGAASRGAISTATAGKTSSSIRSTCRPSSSATPLRAGTRWRSCPSPAPIGRPSSARRSPSGGRRRSSTWCRRMQAARGCRCTSGLEPRPQRTGRRGVV